MCGSTTVSKDAWKTGILYKYAFFFQLNLILPKAESQSSGRQSSRCVQALWRKSYLWNQPIIQSSHYVQVILMQLWGIYFKNIRRHIYIFIYEVLTPWQSKVVVILGCWGSICHIYTFVKPNIRRVCCNIRRHIYKALTPCQSKVVVIVGCWGSMCHIDPFVKPNISRVCCIRLTFIHTEGRLLLIRSGPSLHSRSVCIQLKTQDNSC
jgi:hypothetical protein